MGFAPSRADRHDAKARDAASPGVPVRLAHPPALLRAAELRPAGRVSGRRARHTVFRGDVHRRAGEQVFRLLRPHLEAQAARQSTLGS